MADKIPVGTTVTVLPPAYVPVYVGINIVVGSSYSQNSVKLAVYNAMLGTSGTFSYTNNTFGATVALSSVISAIQGIAGINSVTITQLNTDNSTTVATLSFAANQIPYLLATNLVISATGGL